MDASVRVLIASQFGAISRRQALAGGFSSRQVDERVRSGEWLRVHPGVYRLATAAPCAKQAVWAAALWADAGVLSGLGATWWWGVVLDPPLRWEFVIEDPDRQIRQPRIAVQRRWIDPADITVQEGMRVISLPLAILRGATALETRRRGHGVRLIDRSKQLGTVTSFELEAAFNRNRGTWGTKVIRELLERTGDRAHSDLERLGVSILTNAGIGGFVVNLRLTLSNGRGVELDVAFEELKVGIEFDGFPYHSSTEAQEADALRQNDLVRDGWTILRLPPGELENHPARFVALVRATLLRVSGLQSPPDVDQ